MDAPQATLGVRYVGKKPTALDNVAKSGKCWQGYGDVQMVTARQAKILTGYADQWALAMPDEVAAMEEVQTIEIVDGAGLVVAISEQDLAGPLEKMTVAELLAYAQITYGKTLNGKLSRKVLLDEVLGIVDVWTNHA